MKKIKFKIWSIYAITIIISSILIYFCVPTFLVYGPGTYDTNFDHDLFGMYFYEQVIIITTLSIILFWIVFNFIFKDIDKYKIYQKEYNKTRSPDLKKKINRIKKICFNFESTIIFVVIIIFTLLAIFVKLMYDYDSFTMIKLFFIFYNIYVTSLTIAGIPVSKILRDVLIDLNNTDLPKKTYPTFHTLCSRAIPLLTVALLFSYLIISSLYENNKGKYLNIYYNTEFSTIFGSEGTNIESYDEFLKLYNTLTLENESDIIFILNENRDLVYSSDEISKFFLKYAKELAPQYENRVYDGYSSYSQGTIYPIKIENKTYYIGAKYEIYSRALLDRFVFRMYFIFTGLFMALCLFIRKMSSHLEYIEKSIKSMLNSNNDNHTKMCITSNDDFGVITYSINKIEELSELHTIEAEETTNILMEKERLSSLGELIGGVSHNLKTPIMSISGSVEGINDLITEYDNSIDDPQVTPYDHHEIAKDMSEYTSKIRQYLEYMSDIITTVKSQAIADDNTGLNYFTINDLLKRIDILMKHELSHSYTNLVLSVDVDPSTKIEGNIVSLIQVINNMISNSIQAYNGKQNQNIELSIYKKQSNIIIKIKDYAGGLPKEVKSKLFKQTITTKGKNGTGLGLFMSYSNIKARFNGDIQVNSIDGEGTEFKIIIPQKGGTK